MGIRGLGISVFVFLLSSLQLQAESCVIATSFLSQLDDPQLLRFLGKGEESSVFRLQLSKGKATVIKFLTGIQSKWTMRDRRARIARKLFIQEQFERAGIAYQKMSFLPNLGLGFQNFIGGISLAELIELRSEQAVNGASMDELRRLDQLIDEGKDLLARAVDVVGPAMVDAYANGVLPISENTQSYAAYQLPDISFTNLIYRVVDGEIQSGEIYFIDW